MSDVEIPKVGSVPKRVLIVIGVGAGGFVAWRYWRARSTPAGSDSGTGFEDPGVLPAVSGAVPDENRFGSGGGTAPSVDDFGFHGTSNDAWSQYVSTQLTQSDKWSYSDITTALGNYLTGAPLSQLQQDIVRSAIAIGGNPPVGQHVIVPGGNVPVTVAPGAVRATVSGTTVTVSFGSVPGAATYNVYRSGSNGVVSGPGSGIQLTGLTPGTAYTIQVAAVSASGTVGPKSTAVSVKIPSANLAKAAKPTITAITTSSAHWTTKAIPYATSYQWYLNGHFVATSDGPSFTATNQRRKTKYSLRVRADSNTGAPGPLSDTAYYTTK